MIRGVSTSVAGELKELASELHTMSQPMTALLCRLEIGAMAGSAEGYEEAVVEGLRECSRLMQSMQSMRERISRLIERA